MGAVYLGQGPDGSEAAVKVIRDEFAADGAFRARFRREVEACSRVQGPRTAELLDSDVDGSPMWLAVRYVPGPTLSAYVEAHGPLAADAVRSLAICLADALGAVWQAGIVHRDLKPSNVILAAEGPVLIDFGIATAADATVITQTGAVVGTTGWMSPEQLRGQPTTAASDLWGWAALLTYAASGRGPFGDGPAEALAWRMLHEPPDPTALSRLPEPLAPVVARCLQTDPTLRPDPEHLPALAAGQTVDESTAVPSTAVEHGTPATQLWNPPHNQPPGPPASQPAARRRWQAAATAGLALAAMTVLALVLYDRNNNDPDRVEVAPTTQSVTPPTTGPSSTTSTSTSTTTAPTTTTVAPSAVEATDFANHSYEIDCFGLGVHDLIDGQSNEDALGATVHLIDAHKYDYTGDGRLEAVVELSCATGANLAMGLALAYEDVDGSLVRRGSPLTTEGLLIRTSDTAFESYEPILGPDTPRCCPDTFERTQWTIDFTTPLIFVPEGPPQTIPATDVPDILDEDQIP